MRVIDALRLSLCSGAAWVCVTIGAATGAEPSPKSVPSALKLEHADGGDQDDLCFWYDAETPAESRIVTSDKAAGLIAVYNLKGEVQQLVKVPKPGNIDIRQDVECHGTKRDIVAVNQRTDGWKLVLLEMNRQTRKLERLDQGDLATGPNYGITLSKNPDRGTLDAIITSEDDDVEQYRIEIGADGRPSSKLLRSWKLGKCEGAVADDELGRLYIAVEEQGVWEVSAEGDQPAPGELVIRLGEHGLKPDLEGISLVRKPDGKGYLFLSSQGQDRIFAYERGGKHEFIGSFSIQGAKETDGLDVIDQPLGEAFPHGAFGCHTAATKNPCVMLTRWEKIAEVLGVSP